MSEAKMSVVEKESIEVIAQSIGVTNLSPDVLPSLSADVEYRLREILQEAIKCMHHAKRTAMTSEDVDRALQLRKIQPLYVASANNSLRFKRALRSKDLFYVEDKVVEFREVIEAPLPKAPLDMAVTSHWLAIEGVQPAIPENAPLEVIAVPYDNNNNNNNNNNNRKPDCKEDGGSIDVKTHVLSIELQLYFEKITELTVGRSNSVIFNKALLSLSTSAGLHPLVPYIIYFVAEEVNSNLNSFQLLFALMRLVWSLLQNPFLNIEPYLHQLMPPVMTCLLAKSLGNKLTDNHWELRNFTANLVAFICRKFGYAHNNLQLRVSRTLLHSFLDPAKAFPQHYGAIKGITALGSNVVRLFLLSNLDPFLQYIEPEMQLEKQKNESRRHEAWRVHGALMCAAGLCVYNQLKMIPNLLSPPPHNIWKRNGKFGTSNPNKRKVSGMMEQPLKKVVTSEGSHLVKVEMQGGSSGFSITRGGSDAGAPRFMANEKVPGASGRKDRLALMSSLAVSRAWKKETNAGHLLPKLYDVFGESMFPFVPSPELCNFHL
ncbi:transcription initiation factor TFIID subunit 6-like [Bidens hawaiensis]|uniref:transcription initiation factor TFIID subunit 6-like n=1 Tax=Bidens hawaiensis TaxID=980011 RepID=UPI004049FE1F